MHLRVPVTAGRQPRAWLVAPGGAVTVTGLSQPGLPLSHLARAGVVALARAPPPAAAAGAAWAAARGLHLYQVKASQAETYVHL